MMGGSDARRRGASCVTALVAVMLVALLSTAVWMQAGAARLPSPRFISLQMRPSSLCLRLLSEGVVDSFPCAAVPSPASPVFWRSTVGVLASGGSLRRTIAGAGWNASGALSNVSFDARVVTLIGISFQPATADKIFAIELSALVDPMPDVTRIEFALQLNNAGQVTVLERGVSRGIVANYRALDTLEVRVSANAAGAIRRKWHRRGRKQRRSALAADRGRFPV